MKRPFVQLALALAALGFFFLVWSMRTPHDRVRGDEGTYLAMAESLALDGDLWFERHDQSRLEADPRPGRKAVILQRTEGRVAYSKPVLYPLLTAPFYRVLGEAGLILFNAICLLLALALLARWFARIWPQREILPMVGSFAALGLLVPYVPWRTSDTLQAVLAIAGLALCLWDLRSPLAGQATADGERGSRARLIVGAFCLGGLISLRLTNAPIAAIPAAALWLAGRRRRALWVAGAIAAVVGLGAATTTWLAGEPSPYLSVRATFTPDTGYPEETGLVGLQSPFDYDRATTYNETKKIVEAPLASVYGALYFIAGRHTGVLWYFPLAVFLVASALRRPDRTTWVVIGAVAALAAFYLIFIPFNYFGGATCVGNRYFLVSYAALPFALARPLGRRSLALAWGLGLVVALSALVSVLSTRDRDVSTQNHAYAGIFRLAPFESTAARIDGDRHVYWGLDFGRFVDPFAEVGSWRFVLDSADPPAQVELANLVPEAPLRLLVLSDAPQLDLVYRDWAQRLRIPLEAPVGEKGLVEIQPARPVRYHPLWFRNVWDHGLPYHVRDFRLAVRTPNGRPSARAEIRYLGDHPWPEEIFSRRVRALDLPRRAQVGETSEVLVEVENTSSERWDGTGPFPVLLSYCLTPEDGSGAVTEGPRTSLGGVAAGGAVERRLRVTWPTAPGPYRLTVDLLIEGVAWFEARVGRPLAQAVVEVVPAASSGESSVETPRLPTRREVDSVAVDSYNALAVLPREC